MSRNAQTKVMTKACKNKGKCHKEPMTTRMINEQTAWNADDQAAVGYSLASNWLKGWFEFLSQPIRERSEERPMQYGITFHSQFIIAPIASWRQIN